MNAEDLKEAMEERRVTYTLEMDGGFVIVENVPARICVETGEQFFAPETVEELQQTNCGKQKPKPGTATIREF